MWSAIWIMGPNLTCSPLNSGLDLVQIARMASTRRYAETVLTALPLQRRAGPGGLQMFDQQNQGPVARYLKRSEPMPAADWDVWVLVDTANAEREARVVAVAVTLGLALAGLGLWVLVARRARLRAQFDQQARAKADLESRVSARTSELAAARDLLEEEVAERRAREADLRQAQADLVQAGKMAALGQMSAALSHEFNQPLAAARNYADNALVLLDRDRTSEARSNLEKIVGLIDRMGAISRHLRNFARKPGQKQGPVNLADTIAAAEEIAGLRLRAAGADLLVDIPANLPPVLAGAVRLQQVLVNILTNAADAVETCDDRRLHLHASADDHSVRLTLRDHGPGLAAGVIERIFDPFYSTKGVGKGLGLGLSISYNIIKDFGGNLSAWNAEDGGAVFCIDLPRADLELVA